MPKELVDQGGFILLGTTSGGSELFEGKQVQQASLVRTAQTVNTTGSGDGYPSEKVIRRGYELSGTAWLDTEAGLFAVGDTCYATYYSQHDEGAGLHKALFKGQCVVVRIADSQQQGGYETQEIALRSNGAPDA